MLWGAHACVGFPVPAPGSGGVPYADGRYLSLVLPHAKVIFRSIQIARKNPVYTCTVLSARTGSAKLIERLCMNLAHDRSPYGFLSYSVSRSL